MKVLMSFPVNKVFSSIAIYLAKAKKEIPLRLYRGVP